MWNFNFYGNSCCSSCLWKTLSPAYYLTKEEAIKKDPNLKTTLQLSVCYWKLTNEWPFLSTATMKNREPQWRNCGRRLQSSWQTVLRRTFILKTVLQLSWIQATFPYTYSVKPTQLRHSTDQTSMSLQVLKVFSNSGKHLNPLTQGWNHS